MKGNRFIYVLFLLLIISSTNKRNKDKKIQDLGTNFDLYIVDIDNAVKEDKIFLYEYFKMPKTIILETTPKSLIGELDRMQVTDEYIFILDRDISKGVFVFNKEGKFIHQIGQIGHGPGEYKSISDFTLDKEREEIYLMDTDRETINKYNYKTGKFIASFSTANTEITPIHIQYHNDRLYTDVRFYNREQGDKYMLQEIDRKTGKQLNKGFNYEEYNKGSQEFVTKDESFFYCRTYGEPKYFQFFMDTILALNQEGFYPYMVIKEENWITEEDVKKYTNISQAKYKSNYISSLISDENIAYNISNYIEFEDMIYFKYSKNHKPINVIFDKKQNRTCISERIWNDLTYSGKLSLHYIGCADEQGIYEYQTLDDLLFFQEIKDYNIINPEMDKYAELLNLDVNSNPVIFYYERK